MRMVIGQQALIEGSRSAPRALREAQGPCAEAFVYSQLLKAELARLPP